MLNKIKEFVSKFRKEKKREETSLAEDDFWLHLDRLEEVEKRSFEWTKLKVTVVLIEVVVIIYFILALLGKVPYF